MELTLDEIVALVGGRVIRGDGNLALVGFASLLDADSQDLSFFSDKKYIGDLQKTRAGAVLVGPGTSPDAVSPACRAIVEVENPAAAFALVVRRHRIPEQPFVPGVHPSASVDESAIFDPGRVSIRQNAVVEAGVRIGAGVEIGAGCYLGAGVVLGEDCKLYPNVTVREGTILRDRVRLHSSVVIGADGFGYELVEGKRRKIDQVGIVQIDDDVEIGAGSTVDRGRFGRTWIMEGTKVDNLVQIGHNCIIGKHCVICAHSAIGGSTVLGDYVTVGGAVAMADHVKVGDRAVLAGRCGVTQDLKPDETYFGLPAIPIREARRMVALTRRLPELFERLKKLEKKAGDGE